MPKLRLIQCGVGGFGGGWIRNHASKSPDFDLVAIADVSPAALSEAGDAVGIPADRRFGTLEAAIAAVPADAVLTVTPPAVHLAHAKLAFAHGLHLMTEKPIADTLPAAKEMVRLAAAAGRQLLVSQNYRFKPAPRLLRDILANNSASAASAPSLGAFGHGHIDFYIPADFTGSFRQAMRYPLLIDMAIHHMDLIRCITGRNIRQVTAFSFRPSWSWYDHEPGLKMILELDGGLPFSYSGDWCAKGRVTPWDGNWRLQCAQGALHWEDGKILLSRCEPWNRNPSIQTLDPPPIPYESQAATLHAFAEAIRTASPAETSGADNLHSFAAVIAAVMSAEQKRAVDVEELLLS
jgi:predicted dehydrogenase